MITRKVSKNPRPIDNLAAAIVDDWLASNGIDELMPEKPTIEVDNTHKRIIYRAFKFEDDDRGHDPGKLFVSHSDVLVEDRVMPLLASLTPIVRDAFQQLEDVDDMYRATLVEVTNGAAWSTKGNGFADRDNRMFAEKTTSV